MKTNLLILALLLCFGNAFSQELKFNAVSLEGGFGLHAPLSPVTGISRSNYVAVRQLQFGGRYMFSRNFGLKGSYTYNGFRNNKNKDEAIDFHRFSLEAVYNVGRLLGLPLRVYEQFGLLAHGGLGYTKASPILQNKAEQIGNLQFGLSPQLKVSNRVALFLDGTYIINFKQHYGYNGQLLSTDYKDKTGAFGTISLGMMFYIGENGRHADWY